MRSSGSLQSHRGVKIEHKSQWFHLNFYPSLLAVFLSCELFSNFWILNFELTETVLESDDVGGSFMLNYPRRTCGPDSLVWDKISWHLGLQLRLPLPHCDAHVWEFSISGQMRQYIEIALQSRPCDATSGCFCHAKYRNQEKVFYRYSPNLSDIEWNIVQEMLAAFLSVYGIYLILWAWL